MQNHGTHVPQFSYSPVSVPHNNQPGANSSTTAASVTAPLPPPPPRFPPPALPPPPPPPISHLPSPEQPCQPPSHQQYPFRPVGQREFPLPSPFYHGVQPRPHGGHIPPPGPVSAGQSCFIPPHSSSYSYNQPPPLHPSHHHPAVTTSVSYQYGSSIPPPQHPQMSYSIQSLPTQIGFVGNAPLPPPVPLPTADFSSFPPNPHSTLSNVPLATAHGPSEPPPPPPAFLPPLPPSPPPMPASLPEESSSDSLLNVRNQFEAAEGIQNSIDEVTDQSAIINAVDFSCEGHSTFPPSKPSLPLIQPMADIPSPPSDIEMEDDIYNPVEASGRLEGANEEMYLTEKDGGLLDYTGLHASHVLELSVLNKDKRTECQISSEGTPGALSPTESPASVIKTNVNIGSVSPPYTTVGLEAVPKIGARDGNPVKLLQNYASDSGSEEKKGKPTSEDEIKTDTVILDADSSLKRDSEIENDLSGRIRNSKEIASPLSDGIAQVTESSNFSCIKEEFKQNESEGVLADKVSVKVDEFVSVKVDEFGRIVRDLTDSDSDEASYYAEQRFKRERKDYRTPLPQSRRRKSRSPRRSKKRSISRSPSPRRRARSPPYSRRISASGGERAKNDVKNNRSECFAFKQGRCYRGSFCRFSHTDNFRGDSTKHYQDRRQQFHDRARDFDSSSGSFPLKMEKVKKIAEDETVHDTELREGKVERLLFVSPDDLSAAEMGKEKQLASLLDNRSPCDGLRPSQDLLLEKNQACEQAEVVDVVGARSGFLQNEGPLLRAGDLVSSSLPGKDPLVHQSRESSSTYYISRDVLAPPTSLPEPENFQQHANQYVIASSVNRENVEGRFLHESNLQNSSLMGGFQWRRPTVPHPSLTNNNFSPLPPMDIQLNSSSHQMHLQGFSAERYSFFQTPPPDCHPTFLPPRPWNNLQAPLSLPPPRADNFSLPNQGSLDNGANREQQCMHPELNSHHQFLPSNSLTSVPGQDAPDQANPCFGSTSQIKIFSGEECIVTSSLGMPSSLNDRDDVVGSSQSMHPPSFYDNSSSKVPILTHYNPYASTFEQVPANFNFSSTAYQVGTGSTQVPDFPSKILGNEQYDPLFDSIELSSTKAKNFGTPRLDDSASSLKGGIFRHPDVEENNKQKDGQHSIINFEDKDSVGETGTDEVDGMENVSQENPTDTGGEIENDQAQSSPRIKKKSSKDSKSMKLFRIAVANFVKETLKPSWRQGIMSKEAFKTIVRKSVDKVSGAMQDRRLPKSEAKINQYVQSSERKLTKVVMGYLDKYVKR